MRAQYPKNRQARLVALFDIGVAAVDAEQRMPRRLPSVAGRMVAIAIGKAAVPMMAAAQARSAGGIPGLVVAPHGHVPGTTAWPGVRIITAGHPLPDADSIAAAEAALALAAGLNTGDHLLMLVSGGGSALLAAPVAGISLADKAAVTRDLLRSGATIAEINTVRKALSRIKGGRLAAMAAPATVTTWIIADVPGDDPALVASGPTITGPTITGQSRLADARAVLARYGIAPPAAVERALTDPANEPPVAQPGQATIIARPRDALAAIGRYLAELGYSVSQLGDALEGEARGLGAAHAVLARALAATGGRHAIVSGGETSVTMVDNPADKSGGRGGRNLEYALGLALALDGAAGITALAADSDGIDGSSDAAGALVAPDTLARARAAGLDPAAFLAAHDAHGFFTSLGDLFVTGPTLTNVNDIRIILID